MVSPAVPHDLIVEALILWHGNVSLVMEAFPGLDRLEVERARRDNIDTIQEHAEKDVKLELTDFYFESIREGNLSSQLTNAYTKIVQEVHVPEGATYNQNNLSLNGDEIVLRLAERMRLTSGG